MAIVYLSDWTPLDVICWKLCKTFVGEVLAAHCNLTFQLLVLSGILFFNAIEMTGAGLQLSAQVCIFSIRRSYVFDEIEFALWK